MTPKITKLIQSVKIAKNKYPSYFKIQRHAYLLSDAGKQNKPICVCSATDSTTFLKLGENLREALSTLNIYSPGFTLHKMGKTVWPKKNQFTFSI
jgi:hypothetical protein